MQPFVGFDPSEIQTTEPTRSARLKWIVAVDEALPGGRAVNAAICVAAATVAAVPGLLGPDGKDAAGSVHPGLPWAGCTVLGASAEQLVALRERAAGSEGVYLADMPAQAQTTRVYDDYLGQVASASSADLRYYAVSIVGPRNRVAKLVSRLELLS